VQIRGIGPGGNWASKERGDVDEVSFIWSFQLEKQNFS
jgi:hypothetical protein